MPCNWEFKIATFHMETEEACGAQEILTPIPFNGFD